MKVLVTGTAGFIGFHAALKFLSAGYEVVGLDNINDYYDIALKYGRLAASGIDKTKTEYNITVASNTNHHYRFIKLDLDDSENLNRLLVREQFDLVCHLAAQAGVRYSLENPFAYISSNIAGFENILEGCRHFNIRHLVFASSSSVYGLNREMPFSVHKNVDHPISLYAATKKSNELMAHAYSYLFNVPVTGLRFFTVYGPWGRPDMAMFIFTKSILDGIPLNLFNEGCMERDFTYIDDVTDALLKVINNPPKADQSWNRSSPDPSSSVAPYRIYNIGNNNPFKVTDVVSEIEKVTGKKAIINHLPMQPGDVEKTLADIDDLIKDFEFTPSTKVSEGIRKFVKWYCEFYRI